MNDMIFDETTCKWISVEEMFEFEQEVEEDERQQQYFEGLDSDLKYPEYSKKIKKENGGEIRI